jgi:hypothetical protein
LEFRQSPCEQNKQATWYHWKRQSKIMPEILTFICGRLVVGELDFFPFCLVFVVQLALYNVSETICRW